MKKTLILLILISNFGFTKGQESKTPPGDSAVIFAPGIVSIQDRNEKSIVFTKDGKECYFFAFNKEKSGIYSSKFSNNKWEAPALILDGASPWLSYDERKLFIVKWDVNNENIYQVKRSKKHWGTPEILPEPVNTLASDAGYFETANGDIYFHSNRPGGFGGNGDLWCIPASKDSAINLGSVINSPASEFAPCLAADGSFLIFSSDRRGNIGEQDLYISFRNKDAEWTEPVNMELDGSGINIPGWHQSTPSLSPDGKYLFFSRHNPTRTIWDIYWISSKIIAKIKAKVFQQMDGINYFGQTPPGDTATVFAPGFISTDSTYEELFLLSKDGKQIVYAHTGAYWSDFTMMYTSISGEKWKKPIKLLPFGTSEFLEIPIDFSHDGKTMYFNTSNPIPSRKVREAWNNLKTYKIEKLENGWSDPIEIPSEELFPFTKNSTSDTSDIYLTIEGDIFFSEYSENGYQKPVKLSGDINTKYIEEFCSVSPDGIFILYTSSANSSPQNPELNGKFGADIFISFKRKDNTWTKGFNLEPFVSTEANENNPTISPDGKYLFFHRRNSPAEPTVADIFWADINCIIKDLKNGTL